MKKIQKIQKIVNIGNFNIDDKYLQKGIPIENSGSDDEITTAILKFEKLNKNESRKVIMRNVKGITRCRICGINNGNGEYEIKLGDVIYKIPSGYLHYLMDHRIKPDPQFLNLGV